MKRIDPPIGIIVTIPARFFVEYTMQAYEQDLKAIELLDSVWYRVMKNLPILEVLYVYTVYDRKIQHRTNLVEMWRNKTKGFWRPEGGKRIFENCNGIVQGPPLIRAPFEIPHKGFQGFRYTDLIF